MIIVMKILIESDDGSVLSVSYNACVMALLDAGIPMKYVPNAMTIAISKRSSSLIIDPVTEEEKEARAVVQFTINPTATAQFDMEEGYKICNRGQIISMESLGVITKDDLTTVTQCALQIDTAL